MNANVDYYNLLNLKYENKITKKSNNSVEKTKNPKCINFGLYVLRFFRHFFFYVSLLTYSSNIYAFWIFSILNTIVRFFCDIVYIFEI